MESIRGPTGIGPCDVIQRLLKDCQVVVDQPRALDRTRLGEGPLTRLTNDEMAQVEASVKAVLDLT